jgi:hypothetical protein
MKRYEKRLLGHLQEDNSQSKQDPLADVKNAMGEIAYVSGNPLTKTEITLKINNYFLDRDFNVVPFSDLPIGYAAESLPVFLLGLTDFYGGYKCEERNINSQADNKWIFKGVTYDTYSGIVGNSFFTTGITGLDNVIERGDLVTLFAPANTNPGFPPVLPGGSVFFAMQVIHCNNVAYGTFLNSFVSDLITINTLRLIVPIANINQYVNALRFGYQTLFGKSFWDSIDPRMYITSTDFQQQICDIPINLPIDKAVMLGFLMLTTLASMQIILFVEKVEPLTHKSNLSKR